MYPQPKYYPESTPCEVRAVRRSIINDGLHARRGLGPYAMQKSKYQTLRGIKGLVRLIERVTFNQRIFYGRENG